jgi:hypothetical protein
MGIPFTMTLGIQLIISIVPRAGRGLSERDLLAALFGTRVLLQKSAAKKS